tara:strand:+ start:828 stop:1259 length:432 start_codon:yes stop_codon:yes gene_type:complete
MNILYLGLGIAMITGISAMMQIANNLNNIMFLSTFKQNEYFQSSLPTYDRRILEILDNYSGPEADICSKINESINDTLYEDGGLFLSTGTQTPSINSLFDGSCVLVNKDLSHRVLIKKSNLGTYNLFSCYLKNETFCPYEVNK